MKRILVALLFVTTVIGMSMPGMADPRINITKTVNINVVGSNTASSSIAQSLTNTGDETNIATVLALGGYATGLSLATANGMATNSGNAKVMEGDGSANAGNTGSGNAAAASTATATGGNAINGDVNQANTVSQWASAVIATTQLLQQEVNDIEIIVPRVDVSGSIFDNTMGDDNLIEVGCETCGK